MKEKRVVPKVQAVGRGLGHSHTRPDTARIRRMARNGFSFSPWSAADEAFEGAAPVIRFGMNG
jgi:hypothetical protein